MKRLLLFLLGLCAGSSAWAGGAILSWDVSAPMERTYHAVQQALEAHHFFVVYEVDIGANLAHFADRWGKDYNRNGLDGIRSMVFCNGWYANQVGNRDPAYLAMCPLRLSLVAKGGHTHVYFVDPAYVARGSKAADIARELSQDVAGAIAEGVAAAKAH